MIRGKYKLIFDKHMQKIEQIEPEITIILTELAKLNNGQMDGLEYKFKSFDSTLRKIRDRKKDKNILFLTNKFFLNELINLKDLLRYTMVFETKSFTINVKNVLESLKMQKFELKELKNRFYDTDYKDIITHYSISDEKIKINFTFEVQFHTPETLKNKTVAHYLYEITRQYEIKLNKVDKNIKENITKALIQLYKDTEIPKNVSEIQDIK